MSNKRKITDTEKSSEIISPSEPIFPVLGAVNKNSKAKQNAETYKRQVRKEMVALVLTMMPRKDSQSVIRDASVLTDWIMG